MLNFSVLHFGVQATAVCDLLVFELEVVAVNNFISTFLEEFEKSGILSWINIITELTIRKEVLTVDAMVVLIRERECLHIEAGLSGLDTATETRLVVIKRDKVDTSVSVHPKATQVSLHVATGHPRIELNIRT